MTLRDKPPRSTTHIINQAHIERFARDLSSHRVVVGAASLGQKLPESDPLGVRCLVGRLGKMGSSLGDLPKGFY